MPTCKLPKVVNTCPKCAGVDLYVLFIPNRTLINHSGRQRIENEFITSNEYDFYWQHVAAKDHLRKHCRTCQYQWLENTADATS
jgi:hypothetical protein